jgi:CRP/FNR family transcriptional regulator
MERPTDKCPICSTQEAVTTEQILKVLQKRTYPKHAVICEKDENCGGLYLIAEGSVRVSKITPAGKETLIQILSPGHTFGEAGLLGQEKNADTVFAAEDTQVFFIPKKDFEKILATNPDLYRSVVDSLIRWMNKLNMVIENISIASAKERVWAYLTRLQEEQQLPLIHLSGKKHEVALMLGLRPETFSRSLSELESDGAIKMNHKQIQILKTPKELSF